MENLPDGVVVGSDVEIKGMPCPSCGKQMHFYGGSAGYICCDYKILIKAGGWFDEKGLHIRDDRLAGGGRRVDGEIREHGK
jgi:hypothetical protein